MANEKNLIPLNKRSEDKAKEIQRKGGIARGKQMTQAKTLKECAKLLMSMPPTDKKAKEIITKAGVSDEDITNGMLATIAIFKQATSGNVSAYKVLMEAENTAESKTNDEKTEQAHEDLMAAIKKVALNED